MKCSTTLWLFSIVWLSSCQWLSPKKEKSPEAINQLLQTDADFSNKVQKEGYRMAFLEYMENDAVLLRNHYLPIVGADAVKFVTGFNDSTFSVKWDPQGGDVAISEDIGYTWGVYTITTSEGTQKGSYLTVWRKQEDGRWKFTHDASTLGSDLSEMAENPQ